ncbi:MAG: hypothetical protein K9I94_15385 [Bacteroidales bacterium]|nr:hypothetical protein [Bacteroidales bacterium]
MSELDDLKDLVLAPYIMKATALIGVSRKVGGNQFRHAFATLGILLDYKYFSDSVLLKASMLHDLFEDVPQSSIDEVRNIDAQAGQVVNLVLEVTKRPNESKATYLERVLQKGSPKAHLLKSADRISNLTDLHLGVFSTEKMSDYLDQTEEYVIPMAKKVNGNMVIELRDLISRRRKMLKE